jgi:hypothetical protein
MPRRRAQIGGDFAQNALPRNAFSPAAAFAFLFRALQHRLFLTQSGPV